MIEQVRTCQSPSCGYQPPANGRITELRVEVLIEGHRPERIPAIRHTVVQVRGRFVNRQRAAARQHALEEVHEIVGLPDKFQQGDALLPRQPIVPAASLLRHLGLLARDQQPQPPPCADRGRPPGEGHVVARLPAARVLQETAPAFLVEEGQHRRRPGHRGERRHPLALRFALEHPAAPQPLQHLIGLQHEGALDFRAFPHDIRPAHGIGALQAMAVLLEQDAGGDHAAPGDDVTHPVRLRAGVGLILFIDGHTVVLS